MSTIDASIILNLHKEGVFLQRTLLSLDEAVRFASNDGVRCELVVVLDRADERTTGVVRRFDLSAYAAVQFLEVDNGSLGLSRNDGITAARGEYILTADGDDLTSRNFIRDVVRMARTGPKNCLYFPEFVFGFGGNYYIGVYHSLKGVTPFAFIDMHPYISRVCTHRSAFAKLCFDDHRLSKGYAFEDWHFNAEAVAYGFDVRVVPDAILFYRQRANSLLQQANAQSSRQIAPCKLFDPATYLEICAPFAKEVISCPDSGLRAERPSLESILARKPIKEALLQANAIEPFIRLGRYREASTGTNAQSFLHCGIAYYRICELIGDQKFDEVFLFPFISRGGAERYVSEIINSIYRQAPEKNILIILGEDFNGPSHEDRLPPCATIINLQYFHESLSLSTRLIIALKLIQSTAPRARIHIRQSFFGDDFLRDFGVLFPDRKIVYYRFMDYEILEEGSLVVGHSPLGLISDSIEYLTDIVTDNDAIVQKDLHRIGLDSAKWKVLAAPISSECEKVTLSPNSLQHVLWASRLDHQKRPAVLPRICHLLRDTKSLVSVAAFGGTVIDGYGAELFDGSPNLIYGGPFDGFSALPIKSHGIFLYTSLSDGIPNILLEAMAAGLVVIAPDVGGISEIVRDGETGILLQSSPDDEVMARRYVDAILRVSSDPLFAETLANNALKLMEDTRSYEVYDRRVAKLFLEEN